MLVYADGFSPWKMTMTYCTKYEDLVSNYKYIVSRLEATVTRRWSIDEKHSVSSIKLHVLTLSHADRRGRMTSCRSWIRCCWSPSLEESPPGRLQTVPNSGTSSNEFTIGKTSTC